MTKLLLISLLLFIMTWNASAQDATVTYAEKLGFAKGAKVLILHVDDAGMSFEANEGTIQAITKGAANSCSVMMPCPWVPGFVQFLKENPGVDAGLHLTLTSEWKKYRWGPLAGKPAVPGLVDSVGALWPNVPDVVQRATAAEVGQEIRAQLQRARDMGFEPTHFDSHMGTLFATPQFLEQYIRLGIENRIPVMLPAGHATLIAAQNNITPQQMQQLRYMGQLLWNAGLPVIDDLHNSSYGWKPGTNNHDAYKVRLYIDALRDLKPGLTMMIMHCTATTEVFAHISDSGPSRKADLAAMLDPGFKAALQREGIVLTTWRELMERRKKIK